MNKSTLYEKKVNEDKTNKSNILLTVEIVFRTVQLFEFVITP